MGVINDFIDNLASVIHSKKKDDEEEKRKRDAQRTVFHEDEFKPKEKSIAEKAGDFIKSTGKALVDNNIIGIDGVTGSKQNFLDRLLENTGKLAQKMPDTTIKTTPVEKSKYKDREEFDPKTGKLTKTGQGYSQYTGKVGPVDVPLSEMGGKLLPLISSMPGDIVRSYGKSAENLGTDEGRKRIAKGAKEIPGLVKEVVQDPTKITKAFDNPAISTAMDASDFIPGFGLISLEGKKLGKEAIEKAVREGAEKKLTNEVTSDIARHAADVVPPSSVIPESEFSKDAISSLDNSGASNKAINNEAGRSMAETQVPPSNTSALDGNPVPSTVNRNTSSSNRTNFVASFGISKPSQSDITKFYGNMQEAEKPFLSSLNDVTNDVGGDVVFRLKSPESIQTKLGRKEGRTLADINDTFGATITVDDPAKIPEAIAKAKEKLNITKIDDHRDRPTFLGYRSVHLDSELPNGAIAEVQVNTKQGLYQKAMAHEIYDKWRGYIEHNGSTTMGDVVDLIKNKDPQKLNEFMNDVQLSNDIYAGKVQIPEKYIQHVDKQFADTRTKVAAAVGAKPDELPLINRPRGGQAEETTSLWEKEYLPKMNELLTKAKTASPEELPAYRDQIKALEDEFSKKVDDMGFKERKFITSAKEEPSLNPEIRQGVEGEYKVRANEELVKTVQGKIDADPQGSLEHVLSSNAADDEQVAMGIDLIRRANNSGDTSRAIDIIEALAPKLTEAGRTVQAASLLGRLTPEGALIYTQRLINKATKAGEKAKKITPKTAEEIGKLAEDAGKAIDGSRDQAVKAAKLAKRINQEMPSSLARKVSTIQTIAQLLNPKTTIRNFLGNTGFGAIENIKDVVATPIDMATGLITRERFKTFPSLPTQAKGYVRGFKEGASDALKGIDTSAQAGKFDLAKTSAFATKSEDSLLKKVVYKPIDVLERITSLTLKAPDRAAYQAAYDESLRQMMRVRKVKDIANATDEMKAVAHMDGLYRTFQDDTIASKMFGQIKSGLNVGKEFGAGDLVLKYPKTPGNILARGIEYSPIGFFSAAINLGKMVMGKPMSQKAFVESTSRALVGSTALVATGAILHQMGIITGKPDTDGDIKALDKTQGGGDYRLNTSALVRFIASGFDKSAAKKQEGDNIMTYDWFQPQAINFAMGADIDANNGVNPKSLVGTLIGSAASASNTLVELPLVSGISRLFNYGDLPGGVAETLAGAPSSFTPTILNQVKQFLDNTSRDPEDPDLAKKAINLVENKIPGLAKNLPAKYDVNGNLVETYQDKGNNWFNVFFNPSFSSKIETTPEGREIMRLFDETGESSQAPRQQGNTIQINGKSKQLNGEEKQKYQQYIGVKTREYFKAAMKKDAYKEMSDEKKVKALSNILTDVAVAAKHELFGHNPKQVDRKDRVRKIMNMEDPIPLISR